MNRMRIHDVIHNFVSTKNSCMHETVFSQIEGIDRIAQGWEPGDLCVIGARPAMGKTALILSVIKNLVSAGTEVALFTARDCANMRFLARLANNLTDGMPCGNMDADLYTLSHCDFSSVPLHFIPDAKMSISKLRNTAIKLVKEENVKCIFVETLQSLFYIDDRRNSKYGIYNICAELKDLAVELNVPIVITSEVDDADRDGLELIRPQVRELSMCDSIDNIADSIWLLYRPEYFRVFYDEYGRDLRGTAIVAITQNKYKPCGDAYITYDADKCIFN